METEIINPYWEDTGDKHLNFIAAGLQDVVLAVANTLFF